jgi:3-dehydroquinate dehydratase I
MGSESKICISIGKVPFDTILGILSQVDMAEIRLDLATLDEKELKTIFSSHTNLIATCREGDYDDNTRAGFLKRAIKHGAAWVDLEADAEPAWRDMMIKQVKETDGCQLILSRHFFTHTPSSDELRNYAGEMFSMGADIVKIASQVNQPSDAAVLLGLYGDYKNIVSIGMGPLGVITRVASPFLDAPFTFASFGENPVTAAGQVELTALNELIEKISSYG